MEFRNVNTSNLTFKYPVTWEKEKADTYNNPDCVATLSKGEENLLNIRYVLFQKGYEKDFGKERDNGL